MADDYYGESKLKKLLRPDDPKTQTIMTIVLLVVILGALYFVIRQVMGPSSPAQRDHHYHCKACKKEFVDTIADQRARMEESNKKMAEISEISQKAAAEDKTLEQYAKENDIDISGMGYGGGPGGMGYGMPGMGMMGMGMGIKCKKCKSMNTVMMQKCPSCGEYYVNESMMMGPMGPGGPNGMMDHSQMPKNICTHCNVNVTEFRQKKAEAKRKK